MVVLALTAAACAGATAVWMLDRRRCRRRNEQGRCGACGLSWNEARSRDRYLIHGRLICEDCAVTARRRMPWELGALGGWIAVVAGYALAALPQGSAVELALVIAGSTCGVLVGTVQLMKLQNRRAQKRIATGEQPSFGALDSGVESDSRSLLAEGTAV